MNAFESPASDEQLPPPATQYLTVYQVQVFENGMSKDPYPCGSMALVCGNVAADIAAICDVDERNVDVTPDRFEGGYAEFNVCFKTIEVYVETLAMEIDEAFENHIYDVLQSSAPDRK